MPAILPCLRGWPCWTFVSPRMGAIYSARQSCVCCAGAADYFLDFIERVAGDFVSNGELGLRVRLPRRDLQAVPLRRAFRMHNIFSPGMLAVMIILFTAIFATISVIEDRREGFLQSVLARRCRGWSVVIGKVLVGADGAAHAAGINVALFMLNRPACTIFTVPAVLVLLFVIRQLR